MHGLVSLLEEKYYKEVESIWQMLEGKCGLSGIKATPFPHFSWLIASDFDWEALETVLEEIAQKTRPFIVNTSGIGIFSGASPVIFIPIIRTQELNILHQHIWEAIQPCGEGISPYYSPKNWVPHITLAQTDLTQENISCAMQKLAFQNFNWEIKVDNISFIQQDNEMTGQQQHQYKFQGK
jgi:2'-5' RNA ligase